jgi:hypothetical protein
LDVKYGDLVDISALWQNVVGKRSFFSINSAFFRTEFFDPLFAALDKQLSECDDGPPENDESETLYKFPIIDNVPQTTYDNMMHKCGRCVRAGRPARNVRSSYKFIRCDESGIEKLCCLTCGNNWSR